MKHEIPVVSTLHLPTPTHAAREACRSAYVYVYVSLYSNEFDVSVLINISRKQFGLIGAI